MASITKLSALAAELKGESVHPTCTYHAIDPAEQLSVTTTAETWQWVAADLVKRQKRLHQCVLDPKTRPNKREKRDHEYQLLTNALEAIKQVLPL